MGTSLKLAMAGFFASVIGLHMQAASAADAWPAECKLQREGSLPFTQEHGHVMIEAMLSGVPRHFIVDTGAVFSSISAKAASDQSLPVHQLTNLIVSGIGGEK